MNQLLNGARECERLRREIAALREENTYLLHRLEEFCEDAGHENTILRQTNEKLQENLSAALDENERLNKAINDAYMNEQHLLGNCAEAERKLAEEQRGVEFLQNQIKMYIAQIEERDRKLSLLRSVAEAAIEYNDIDEEGNRDRGLELAGWMRIERALKAAREGGAID